jgi:hypothetical protein
LAGAGGGSTDAHAESKLAAPATKMTMRHELPVRPDRGLGLFTTPSLIDATSIGSLRVGAPQNFDHLGLADLKSGTEPLIERAAHSNRLPPKHADRLTCFRERRLQLARNDDRRAVLGNKINIEIRPPKANPAHSSLDDDKLTAAPPERSAIG